jgi:ribulose-phosphate 3-epimerase
MDVHLMITRPDLYFPRFTDCAKNITIHVEADCNVAAVLSEIRAAGCTAGISLKPGTPFSLLEPHLADIDLLLVMTVEPGFGGQAFMHDMLEKVRAAAEVRATRGFGYRIQVDGGINAETGALAVAAGADTLVAGSSVFGAPDMAAAIAGLRAAASAVRPA